MVLFFIEGTYFDVRSVAKYKTQQLRENEPQRPRCQEHEEDQKDSEEYCGKQKLYGKH